MSADVWIAFLVAAAVGAPARYLLDGLIQDRTRGEFPWGTCVVNVSGSFILGLLSGLALYHAFPADAKIVLGTGFCGAYTTFSTFTFETVRLAEAGLTRAGDPQCRGQHRRGAGGGRCWPGAGLALIVAQGVCQILRGCLGPSAMVAKEVASTVTPRASPIPRSGSCGVIPSWPMVLAA